MLFDIVKYKNLLQGEQMEKSPLSGAFHATPAPEQKKRKSNKAVLLISGIALASSLGGVFAATTSITVNDGNLEFGQGLADAAVCDETIDTNLTQTYDSADGEFYVNKLVVSDVDLVACDGKTITWSLLGSDGAVLVSGAASGEIVVGQTANTDGDYIMDFYPSVEVVAASVEKVTITSKD